MGMLLLDTDRCVINSIQCSQLNGNDNNMRINFSLKISWL
jgi:hypothetical protein